MRAALGGLEQVAAFAHPRVARRLREAGALDPKGLLGLIGGLPWLVGRGPSLGIMSHMHAISLGHKTALHDRNGSLTWWELDRRANRAAHALRGLGLVGGEQVALLLRNGREMAEVMLGAQKVGVVSCPLNTWAKPKELKSTLDTADAKALIYDTKHAEQVEECAPEELQLLFVGDEADALEGSYPYESLILEQSSAPPVPFTREAQSPKIVIHTSGTTGKPKGASRNASAAGVASLANLLSVVPYRREDVILCPAPLFHSFGLATFTFGAVLGATFVFPEKFDPEESLELIEEHCATAASFVPVMIKRIVTLDDDVKSRYDLSSLRILLASGSAMGPELRRAAMKTFGDVIYDLYGSTEAGWVTIATPQDMEDEVKTVGRPVPGIDVAIFSPHGDRLEAGETGEVFVKSELVFEGYTSGEDIKQRDGYISIGDLGRFDDKGYLYVEGRADDMVVIGGENIYPAEIEEVIGDIDSVDDVAVLGVPDEEYGQVLGAFVVGSADLEKIKEVCKSELASYKVPKRIEKIDELPRTSTGKVVKRELTADWLGEVWS